MWTVTQRQLDAPSWQCMHSQCLKTSVFSLQQYGHPSLPTLLTGFGPCNFVLFQKIKLKGLCLENHGWDPIQITECASHALRTECLSLDLSGLTAIDKWINLSSLADVNIDMWVLQVSETMEMRILIEDSRYCCLKFYCYPKNCQILI